MASQYLQINFYYFSFSLSIRFPLRIKCSLSVLLTCPVRYFSIIKLAIGAAQVEPQPPFSIYTATVSYTHLTLPTKA